MYIFEGRQKVGFCCNFTYFFIILPPMFLLIVLCQYPSFVLFSNLPKKAWEISRKQHCAWDTSTSSLLLFEWTFLGKGEEPQNSGEDPQPHSCTDFRETQIEHCLTWSTTLPFVLAQGSLHPHHRQTKHKVRLKPKSSAILSIIFCRTHLHHLVDFKQVNQM